MPCRSAHAGIEIFMKVSKPLIKKTEHLNIAGRGRENGAAERSDEHALDTMIFHDFEICLR